MAKNDGLNNLDLSLTATWTGSCMNAIDVGFFITNQVFQLDGILIFLLCGDNVDRGPRNDESN